MVLHQAGAISYDAVHLVLFPLLFAYLTRFLTQEGTIRRRDLLAFMAILWWAVNIRSFAYDPLLLLFLVVPASKIATTTQGYLKVAGAYLGVTALTTAVFGVFYLAESRLLAPDAVGISASSQVKFVLGHPLDFLAACYRTVQYHGELLLRQGFGVFGWIDYAFNFAPYYLAAIAAGVVTLRTVERDELELRPYQMGVLLLALGGTAGALFLSLYAVWSPVGSGVVGGLQGRYFVGMLPFAIFGVSQLALDVGKGRFLQALALLVCLFLVFSIVRAILGRYY